MNQLGGLGGVGGDLVKKLLPILAPIVLAWLARKFAGSGAAAAGDAPATAGSAPQQDGGLGGLGDLLGGLLGGGRK